MDWTPSWRCHTRIELEPADGLIKGHGIPVNWSLEIGWIHFTMVYIALYLIVYHGFTSYLMRCILQIAKNVREYKILAVIG